MSKRYVKYQLYEGATIKTVDQIKISLKYLKIAIKLINENPFIIELEVDDSYKDEHLLMVGATIGTVEMGDSILNSEI